MTIEDIKNITVTDVENSSVKIEAEVPFELLETHRKATIKAVGANMEVDGFRKGHVPENVIVERVGEMAILGEMAERAIKDAYPLIVTKKELDVIGYPQISITKLAEGNPLGFSALVAIVPEITLPDFKAIAQEKKKEKESVEVTEEDVTKATEDMLRQKVAYERIQKKAAAKPEKDTDGTTTLPTPETVEKEHVHTEDCNHDDEEKEEKPEDIKLPELTDEYVKTLGQPGQFETVADFKIKLKEHLSIEKEREITGKNRANITDAIVEQSNFTVPQVLIDAEVKQLQSQMEEDLKRAQLKFEDYLKHINKTKEELVKEWTPSAEKRAKLQLVLNAIAKQEEIKPDEKEVDAEVQKLLAQYKDADETRVRTYIESILTNEAVMKMLEK